MRERVASATVWARRGVPVQVCLLTERQTLLVIATNRGIRAEAQLLEDPRPVVIADLLHGARLDHVRSGRRPGAARVVLETVSGLRLELIARHDEPLVLRRGARHVENPLNCERIGPAYASLGIRSTLCTHRQGPH